jgi:threonine/homoserine/homoserine lactone efflux protein
MALMLFLVAFGLGSLVLTNPVILQGLRWCGIALLLWLSWKIATAGRSEETGGRARVRFWGAFAFQWVNPKAWLVCAGAVGAYFLGEGGNALWRSGLLAALFILAALPSCFVWLAVGAGSQRFLRGVRASRIFNVTMGALLAGSIVLFIW